MQDKATVIDNREGMIAKAAYDLTAAADTLDELRGALIQQRRNHRTADWATLERLHETEGRVRAVGLDLQKELGLLIGDDIAPEGTRADEPPEMMDAEVRAAIEEALRPTGLTESLLPGDAVLVVDLPGGLVVTVERPEEPPAAGADGSEEAIAVTLEGAAIVFGGKVYDLLADHWSSPRDCPMDAKTADGRGCTPSAKEADSFTFTGACDRVIWETDADIEARALFVDAVDGAFKGRYPEAWEAAQDDESVFGEWENGATPLHLLALINRGIEALVKGEVAAT